MKLHLIHMRALIVGVSFACSAAAIQTDVTPTARPHDRRDESHSDRHEMEETGPEMPATAVHGEITASETDIRLRASLGHTAYTRSMPQKITLKGFGPPADHAPLGGLDCQLGVLLETHAHDACHSCHWVYWPRDA